MLSYQGKIVVVTGAGKGLGRFLALRFARSGAVVAAHYHTSARQAHLLSAQLQRLNKRSQLFQADLRSVEEVKIMFDQIHHVYKRVDVLVNVVGNFIYKPYDEVTIEDMDDVMETNLRSTFLCSRMVLDGMKKRARGTIINFGCAGADRMTIRDLTTPYYIAKGAVLQLTKIMAKTYAPYGIRVNAVSPGILKTSIAKVDNIPAGRYADFNDIAGAIEFLLSPSSRYLNGANIEVAGGWIP